MTRGQYHDIDHNRTPCVHQTLNLNYLLINCVLLWSNEIPDCYLRQKLKHILLNLSAAVKRGFIILFLIRGHQMVIMASQRSCCKWDFDLPGPTLGISFEALNKWGSSCDVVKGFKFKTVFARVK